MVTCNNCALCNVQRMRPDYKEHYRATAVGYILSFAARLSIVDDYAHDAVLLMDRAMSTCIAGGSPMALLCMHACSAHVWHCYLIGSQSFCVGSVQRCPAGRALGDTGDMWVVR